LRNAFEISVKAIDGAVLNNPQVIVFECKKVEPVGIQIIRMFDANSCIVNRKLFFFRQGQNLFGTEMFRSLDEWQQYMGVVCKCCVFECVISYKGCALSYNDCFLTWSEMIISN
jgi:hypothetical protein